MSKELKTEQEVKNMLGIQDFRQLKKTQIIDFVSNLPNMDTEVAKACIDQFPAFKEYSNNIIDRYIELCNNGIKDIHAETISSWQYILVAIKEQLNSGNITTENRNYIIDKMVEIGEKIESVGDKKSHFKENVIRAATAVVSIGIGIGGTLLGVKIKKS